MLSVVLARELGRQRRYGRVGRVVWIRIQTRILVYLYNVLNIFLNHLRRRLYELLVKSKAPNAQTIVNVQVAGQVLRARLHNIVKGQVIRQRVHMRQQIARHLELGRVNVVDANLQGLIVQIVIDIVYLVVLLIGYRVHLIVDAVRVVVVVVVTVVVDDAAYLCIVVMIVVVEEVAQRVGKTKDELSLIAVVIPGYQTGQGAFFGRSVVCRSFGFFVVFTVFRLFHFLEIVENLHEKLGVAGQNDLVAVDVLGVVVQLQNQIAELTIFSQHIEHLQSLIGVHVIPMQKTIELFLYSLVVFQVHGVVQIASAALG